MDDGLKLAFNAQVRDAVSRAQEPIAELRKHCHSPGIYFGMLAAEYHRDPSLGSTNVKDLRNSARKYQRTSWMAEKPVDRTTKATIMGTALHTIVLDGVEKFTRDYVRRPDSYNDLSQGDKSAMTKSIKAKLGIGQEMLSAEDYDLCLEAVGMIIDHDDLRKSLTGGENEISVFWVDQHTGVPCKARFDRLKARGIGDLKSIENERGRPLEIAAMYDIKGYRYDMQAAHYLAGARHIPDYMKRGLINGASPAAKPLLAEAAEHIRDGDFAYQLIFLQKSFADVWSCVLSPENHLIKVASDHVHWAIESFNVMIHRHGIKRWAATWKLGELHAEDLPGGEYGFY